jgi:hypothetical protein
MTKSSTQGCEFNPGAEISTLLQLAGLKFQPWVENVVTAGVEIVHVWLRLRINMFILGIA